MVIINDDYENAVIKEKGVSHVSSTVNDPVDSKTPEASQTLNAGIKEKGIDEDPEVVKSSKKKKKKKNRGRKNTDSGSSSQNSGEYPHFDLNDYPLARETDRNMMNLINDYNRRNHAILSGRERGGFDQQMENLSEVLLSVFYLLRGDSKCGPQDNNNDNKKIWCPRCHRLARRCGC